jgi:hypothetical protein
MPRRGPVLGPGRPMMPMRLRALPSRRMLGASPSRDARRSALGGHAHDVAVDVRDVSVFLGFGFREGGGGGRGDLHAVWGGGSVRGHCVVLYSAVEKNGQ